MLTQFTEELACRKLNTNNNCWTRRKTR